MKTFIILALAALVASNPIQIEDDGTYTKMLEIIDPSFYDEIWDNQAKYLTNDFENHIINGRNAALGQFP